MFFFKKESSRLKNTPDNDLSNLPHEVLWKIFARLSTRDITSLSQADLTLYQAVFRADEFWQQAYLRHFSNITVTSVDNKHWYEIFMETYAADYPLPEARRLALLIKENDHESLSKFIQNNEKITIHLLDEEGQLTQKPILQLAQESRNQNILNMLYQIADQHYKNIAKKICSPNFISHLMVECINSPKKNLPVNATEKQQLMIMDGIKSYLDVHGLILKDIPIEASKLAIADYHKISRKEDDLLTGARTCIELNILVAAAKIIIQRLTINPNKIFEAINYIQSGNSNSSINPESYSIENLTPIFTITNMSTDLNESSELIQPLLELIELIGNAAYTAIVDGQARTILYWSIACHQGPDLVKFHFKNGSSINERYTALGYQPIHIAALLGDSEIAQILCKDKFQANKVNTGNSVFGDYFSLSSGSGIQYLFNCIQKAYIKYEEDEDFEHFTRPLHLAAQYGHAEFVIDLVNKNIYCATARDCRQREPFDIAVIYGQKEVVQALLKLSRMFFTKTSSRDSLLVCTANHHQPDVFVFLVNYLLDERDNLGVHTSQSMRLAMLQDELSKKHYVDIENIEEVIEKFLMWANKAQKYDYISLLVETIHKRDPNYLSTILSNTQLSQQTYALIDKVCNKNITMRLFKLIQSGDLENLDQLITSLDMIDGQNEQGQTLLELISLTKGNLGILKHVYQLALKNYSTEGNIDTKKQDNKHRTILYWAMVCKQDAEIIKLLKAGSKVDEKYLDYNAQPLHIAVQFGSPTLITMLIDYGADVRAPDTYGKLPIELAIKHGLLDVIKLFIKHDKSLINVEGSHKRNLLHHAARYCSTEDILQFLITREVNFKAHDGFGFQPIHLAVKEHNLNAVKVLLEYHHDLLEEQDGKDRTPLAIALEEGHKEIAEHLIEAGANLNFSIKGRSPQEVAESHGFHPLAKLILESPNGDAYNDSKKSRVK